MSWKKGVWKKGRKRLKGKWLYIWGRDTFLIYLDGKDPETGLRRQPFETHNDDLEFNG